MNRFALTFIAVLTLSLPVFAQQAEKATPPEEKPRKRIVWGPEVGFYFPSSDRTRAAFGETWVNYGVGFRPIELATKKGGVGFDLNIVSTRGDKRRATLIPVAAIYKQAIGGGEPGVGTTPYIGVTAGLLFADLRSDNYGVSSGFRGGYGGSALLGMTYRTSAFVEARYQAFNKIKSYDLSGISLTAGYRF